MFAMRTVRAYHGWGLGARVARTAILTHLLGAALAGQPIVSPEHTAGATHTSASSGLLASWSGGGREIVVPSMRSVFPQIAIGGPWRTVLILMNLRSAQVEGTLSFFRSQGTLWEVSLSDGRNVMRGSQFTVRLGANQSLFLETVNVGPEIQSGWARLDSDQRWSITGHAVFRAKIEGRPDMEAVVPAESLKASGVFAFDNTNGFVTSIALAVATSGNPAEIHAEVYSEAGALVETYKLKLNALQHIATELPNLWPATANRRGVVRLLTKTSYDNLFSGLVLLFNPTGAVTSVPLVDTDIIVVGGQ